MAKFTVTINPDNAAFADDLSGELARILRNMAKYVEAGLTEGYYFTKPIGDVNGNTIGKCVYTK